MTYLQIDFFCEKISLKWKGIWCFKLPFCMLHKEHVHNILWQWHCHRNHRVFPGCIWRWSLGISLGMPPIHLCSFGSGNSLGPNRYHSNQFLYPLVDSKKKIWKARQIAASLLTNLIWQKNVSKCKTYIKFTLIDGTIIFAYSGSALHLQIIETETSVFVTSSRVAIRICNVMSIH